MAQAAHRLHRRLAGRACRSDDSSHRRGAATRRRRLRGDPSIRRAAVRPCRPPRPPRSIGQGDRAAASTAPLSNPTPRSRSKPPGEIDAALRLVSTRGGHRVVFVEELPGYPGPARLASVTYETNPILEGVKSLSYAANMQATRIAQAKGADEALFVRADGCVLEAPTSAIFWVSDGRCEPRRSTTASSPRSPARR